MLLVQTHSYDENDFLNRTAYLYKPPPNWRGSKQAGAVSTLFKSPKEISLDKQVVGICLIESRCLLQSWLSWLHLQSAEKEQSLLGILIPILQ